MKAILVFACMAICFGASATIRTVSNNPATIAQFASIQSAIDASSDGDTVYVHGGPDVYAGFLIADKKIAVFGPGWAPDTELQYKVIVTSANINNTANPGSANGSELNGLFFNGGLTLNADNLNIIRCYVGGTSYFNAVNALLVESCVLIGIDFVPTTTYANVLIQNCILYNFQTSFIPVNISGLTNAVSVRFDHNLFYGSGSVATGGIGVFRSNCRNLILTNNIFTRCNPAIELTLSSFSNNITYNCGSGNDAWLINSNTDGGGNISNQNPQMNDQAAVDAAVLNGLLNFTIASGPANNGGNDGKDMGLLYDASGSLNWANSRNSRLPRIYKMKIINPTVASGGNVTVNIEAKVSN